MPLPNTPTPPPRRLSPHRVCWLGADVFVPSDAQALSWVRLRCIQVVCRRHAEPERSNLGSAGPSSSADNIAAPKRPNTIAAKDDGPEEESKDEDDTPDPAQQQEQDLHPGAGDQQQTRGVGSEYTGAYRPEVAEIKSPPMEDHVIPPEMGRIGEKRGRRDMAMEILEVTRQNR